MARARRPGTRKTGSEYTEHALADVRRVIPRIVYLPARLRGHNQYLSLDALQVRVSGPEIIDNHARIQEADPLGFLIAKMHGLPIPRFELECGHPGCPIPRHCEDEHHAATPCKVRITYHTPSHREQEEAAKWLASRVTFRSPNAYQYKDHAHATARQPLHAHDYDAMIRAAADQAPTDQEEGDTDEQD